MLSDRTNAREMIKNRMLKHALNYWNLKTTEDLDPVVKLILEALSLELYNLGNEIQDVQVRILEKVAGLLTPDFLTLPHPAHAIVQAAPVELTALLTATSSFTAPYRVSSRQNEVLDTTLPVAFTPVDTVQVRDVQVAYLATGGSLFACDGAGNRQPLTHGGRLKPIEPNTLWLGLRMHPQLEGIHHLYFYFDWKNLEPRLAHRLYQLLPLARWYLDNQELRTVPGIPYASSVGTGDAGQDLFKEYDPLSLLEKEIKQYYDPMFVTIEDQRYSRMTAPKRPYPSSFTPVFPDSVLQQLAEPLLWLQITFPAHLQQEFLGEVQVHLNAFPVLNRQHNDLKYRLKGGSHIIPLRTGTLEQFLSVHTLTDDTQEYQPVPYRQTTEPTCGTFTLRQGGVERFDVRNAREQISYLLELLRSESAAFAAYGYDFIAGTLKEMNQKMALMEQKTKGYREGAAELPHYIIVKPFEGKDMMYAEYWTTLGEVANNLRAGTRLQPVRNGHIKPEALVLLTTTLGGKNRLRPEERLHAFRYGMMTRDRIITKEDIRNFCFQELGSRLRHVTIERGFEIAASSKEAFQRTIDVILTPWDTEGLQSREWQLCCEQLRSRLQSRSGMSHPYRILLQKPEATA
jgi:hypothetical protein